MLESRESYIPNIALLFDESELRDEGDRYGYVSTVGRLRDRLQLHDFTPKCVLEDFEAAINAWNARHEVVNPIVPMAPPRDANSFLQELHSYVNSTDKWYRYELPEESLTHLDARAILRIALDLVEDAKMLVRYNMDDLVHWDLLERGAPICSRTRKERAEAVARDAPLIVLTEGSSDSQLLTEGLSITHPHLVGFLRFMDFSSGAEGSAQALAKLVRSFIGAGIANRVVAIADNDTAAYDALNKLKTEGLPHDYRILHYPDLPLLRNYPTLGPQLENLVLMDVNGKAGSLEMYLGRDVLKANGELLPVQWTGYIEGQQRYQGMIAKSQKDRVHKAFLSKVEAARKDPNLQATQDWSGIRAIVNTILDASE